MRGGTVLIQRIANNDRARAVAEQNAAAAVAPIDDARKRLGADYECFLVWIDLHPAAGLLKRVNESGASGLQVVCTRFRAAERRLDETRRGGKRGVVRR